MNNRMKMRSAVTLVLVALFVVPSVAVFAPMTVYAAPPTGVPTLDAHFCKATLHGTWTGKTRTCTITPYAVGSSIGTSFAIPSKTTLAIIGVGGAVDYLVISSSVTITNYGVINNSVTINNYGTINNCGTINNYDDGTIVNFGSGVIVIPSCPIS